MTSRDRNDMRPPSKVTQMPTTTLLYASLLGILIVVLGLRVSLRRRRHHVSLGDGGDPQLTFRIRALGNFVEYVPFAILLTALVELSGGRAAVLHGIGSVLLVARISMPPA